MAVNGSIGSGIYLLLKDQETCLISADFLSLPQLLSISVHKRTQLRKNKRIFVILCQTSSLRLPLKENVKLYLFS